MGEKVYTQEEINKVISAFLEVDRTFIAEGSSNTPFDVQRLTLDLTTAKTRAQALKIGFPFKSFYVESATDSGVSVKFIPNTLDQYQSEVSLSNKDSMDFDTPLSKGYIYWDAQASKSITLVFFVRAQFKSGSYLVTSTGGGSASTVNQKAAVSVTDVATLLIASNASRSKLTIQNHGGADICIGDGSVTFANGFMLANGESKTFELNTGAFYAISDAGLTNTVRILEEV